MALSSNFSSGQEKLFYFTGKIRAFWKDKVFFLDQRNAAVIGFENLYVNGVRACQADLHRLDAQVANSDWESAPVFNSYVVKFPSSESPPWPYKLKGKKLWLARYAWMGPIPGAVEEQLHGQNVVYMPLTYYTGKLINMFDDKALYGDYRNNVMVHLSDLCIYGQRADSGDALMRFDTQTPVIHSFVSSLNFLTSKNFDGIEPHLPTWPIDDYGPSTWVAKFAWQGEMPEEFRHHLGRFQIIKITEWNFSSLQMGNFERPFVPTRAPRVHESSFSVAESAKGTENGAKFIPEPLLATTQKEAAIIKGSLLLANHKYGLINSYLDVIVFSTKNFYVNGDIFREGTALDEFFQAQRKVPLTAWIVPLPEPVLVFDVYVMWRAVCVWYGIPPKNMESIKNRYDSGSIAGSVPEALNTTSDNRYTLVMGEIVNVSYTNGFAKAKIGNKVIDITFKRKAIYLNGSKIHTKCTLTEIRQNLEVGVWNMLVYPVMTDNRGSEVNYTALALWQFQHQHHVSADLLFRILLEGGNVSPENAPQRAEAGDHHPAESKMGLHMTGMIARISHSYGIIETRSVTIEPSYIFFLRTDLYVDGIVPEVDELMYIDRSRQVNLFARSHKFQEIDKFPISLYATLVWMGKKPVSVKPDSTEDTANGTSGETSPDDLSPGEGNFQKAIQNIKPSTPVLEHKFGRFAFLRDRYGIIQAGIKVSGYTYILFDFSVVWVQGDRLGANEGLCDSILQDEVHCNLLAYVIPEVEVGGHKVSMQATAVWIGKKPFHIVIPEYKCPLKAMELIDERMKTRSEMKPIPKKIPDYLIKSDKSTAEDKSLAITEKLAKVGLKDSDVGEESDSPEGMQEIVIDPKKPFVGKHISARIIKLMDGTGIAMWRCAAKEGEVYISFSKKNVYVNLCPMDENYKITQAKSCNLFVIPTKYKMVEGHKVSLYAACGWIGSKPHDIPSPGDQDHARVSLDKVFALKISSGKIVTARLVKMMENTGIARWRSIGHGGDAFIEFEKDLVCENIQSKFSKSLDDEDSARPCHFHVKPMEHKELEGYTVSLTTICGWMGKKPSHFPKVKNECQPTLLSERLHITHVDPALFEKQGPKHDLQLSSSTKSKGMDINALDIVNADIRESQEREKKKKKNRLEEWVDEPSGKPDMEGKIVDLHSNVGRLKGTDDVNEHFFSRENSYLYGVCLSNVELWHVLVQDEMVSYRLNELSAGQAKVSKMWIGPEKLEADKAAAHIYEWCSKHLVPEGARDVLICQLEVRADENGAAKET